MPVSPGKEYIEMIRKGLFRGSASATLTVYVSSTNTFLIMPAFHTSKRRYFKELKEINNG
jgi:hypothetical protein